MGASHALVKRWIAPETRGPASEEAEPRSRAKFRPCVVPSSSSRSCSPVARPAAPTRGSHRLRRAPRRATLPAPSIATSQTCRATLARPPSRVQRACSSVRSTCSRGTSTTASRRKPSTASSTSSTWERCSCSTATCRSSRASRRTWTTSSARATSFSDARPRCSSRAGAASSPTSSPVFSPRRSISRRTSRSRPTRRSVHSARPRRSWRRDGATCSSCRSWSGRRSSRTRWSDGRIPSRTLPRPRPLIPTMPSVRPPRRRRSVRFPRRSRGAATRCKERSQRDTPPSSRAWRRSTSSRRRRRSSTQ